MEVLDVLFERTKKRNAKKLNLQAGAFTIIWLQKLLNE